MKKVNLRTLFLVISAIALVFTSCKKDEEEGDPNIPVLNKNFSYTVSVNDVNFTTTLPGNVWFTNTKTGSEFPATDGQATVKINLKGTYKFLCSALIEGVTFTSDTFNVIIVTSDLTYLDAGAWKWLTGGRVGEVAATKTWRLDMNADGKCVYFDGPLYYSGYEDANKVRYPYWAWDVVNEPTAENPYALQLEGGGTQNMTSFFNWKPDYAGNKWIMSAQDYGTITFNGIEMTVSTSKFGVTETGSFDFNQETMKITINNCVIPIDTARINGGQFLENDLHNLRIISVSDSALQIGVKRSFEGGNTSEWVHVYNFVCVGYSYPVPEEFTFQEAPKTSITATAFVGTWKIANVPMGWVGYTKVGDQGTNVPARLFEKWNTRNEVVTTLSSWGLGKIDSVFTANDANTYVFNADGSCTLNGVANNFTVSNGIITFTTALTTEFSMTTSWLNHTLTGTGVTVIDVNHYGGEDNYESYVPQGIWIGQQNDDKNEYKGFQLVKQ